MFFQERRREAIRLVEAGREDAVGTVIGLRSAWRSIPFVPKHNLTS